MIVSSKNPFRFNLSVFKEELRSRDTTPLTKYYARPEDSLYKNPYRTTYMSPSLPSPEKQHSIIIKNKANRINWLKYNTLVGIYENWIRLQPFIKYWLLKQQPTKDEQFVINLKPFLKKACPNQKLLKQSQQNIEYLQLLKTIKQHRDLLLKSIQTASLQLGPNSSHLQKTIQMAKNLLSSLPIENTKWTKNRIERHNKLIQDMIKNFNEEQFHKNKQVIMHSIKERIRFINEIQEKYVQYEVKERKVMEGKVEVLKKPFKRGYQQMKQSGKTTTDELFEYLWDQIKQKRQKSNIHIKNHSKQKKKRANISITSTRNDSKPSISLVLKINKQKQHQLRIKKKKLKTNHKIQEIIDKPKQAKIDNLIDESPQKGQSKEQTPIISSKRISNHDEQMEKINNQYIESFMKKQAIKNRERQKNSLNKRGSNNSSASFFSDDESIQEEAETRKVQIEQAKQEIDLLDRSFDIDQPKQQHSNQVKSHLKIATVKNFSTKRVIIPKDNTYSRDTSSEIKRKPTRFSSKISNMKKRADLELRKGRYFKRGRERLHIEEIEHEEGAIISQNGSYLINRLQILNYLHKIIQSGVMQGSQMKKRVQALIEKYSFQNISSMRDYAQQVVLRSINSRETQALNSQTNRYHVLNNLHQIIKNDQRILRKTKDEMKIFFDENLNYSSLKSSISQQNNVCNNTELRHVSSQLKRILAFKKQGQSITFANRLKKINNQLKQQP